MLTESSLNNYAELQPVRIDEHYPNMLTPPSSSEDSPHSMFYNSSPTSCFSPPDQSFLAQNSYSLNFEGTNPGGPYLRILEQPIEKFRFRYKSEMTGTHGSLCGQTSDRSRKQTFPTVELCNFDKPAVIRCSIYQYNTVEDFKPHAHRLIKKQGKGEVDDPHDMQVSPEDSYVCMFHNMGIIHTAKKNIVPELIRKKTQLKCEEIARIEGKYRPLTTKEEVEIKGLAEAESKSINLNIVCLRFDAFISINGILEPICPPAYSHGINNLKSALTGELKIVRMDHCTSPAKGGREIFILVERVTKKNIKVRFFELDDEDNVLWQDYGRFSDLDVHHQYAIVFKTPPYKDLNITNPVNVYIELERPSDRAKSEPREFRYVPSSNNYRPGAKRARPSYESSSYDTELASDELPATINNLSIVNLPTDDILGNVDMQISSADLQQAMTDINSDEFNRLFNEYASEYQSVTVDAPTNSPQRRSLGTGRNRVGYFPAQVRGTSSLQRKMIHQRQVTPEERLETTRTIEELRNFIKTHPSDEKAISMLNHYFGTENKTNALHISIKENDLQSVMFILKMIFVWRQYHLLNVRSDDFETALQIATYSNLEDIVANLIMCKAEVQVGDFDSNTPLHLAVLSDASIGIFEKLLSVDNMKQVIDLENNDGNTALVLAIEHRNFRALKLLCRSGADVNRMHKKNGYTPLRIAIEKQNVDMTRFILEQPDLDPLIEDFGEINALQAGQQSSLPEIRNAVKEFMIENDYGEVEVKKEVEEMCEDEIEEIFPIKSEQITPEELREMYGAIKEFTPDCLEQISVILDSSGTWQELADLLDLGHLTRTILCESHSSPSKKLLKIALETNGDTVLQIRDFLENLDELQAVEIIDNMVRSQFS